MMNTKPTSHTFQDLIASLEELMVKQFRGLQTLIQITIRERETLAKNDSSALRQLDKEKENMLEDIGIIGDSLHMIFEEIGKLMEMRKTPSLDEDLLPRLDPSPADRINRLREGIMTLYDEVRELSLANQALTRKKHGTVGPEPAHILGDYFSPEIFETNRHLPARKNNHITKPV